MVKFILGMVAGITLLAAALTVFGKPTEVHFESGDQKLLEKIDLSLAIAIHGLDQAHTDHAAQLQRDVAEAAILSRIEERLQTLEKIGVIGVDALGAEPETQSSLEKRESIPDGSQMLNPYIHQTSVYVPFWPGLQAKPEAAHHQYQAPPSSWMIRR